MFDLQRAKWQPGVRYAQTMEVQQLPCYEWILLCNGAIYAEVRWQVATLQPARAFPEWEVRLGGRRSEFVRGELADLPSIQGFAEGLVVAGDAALRLQGSEPSPG